MLGNYLITEDTTMKAFKKLMAAALVCVMALTMLTGCAVSDNLVEKALVNKLNAVSAVSYESTRPIWTTRPRRLGTRTRIRRKAAASSLLAMSFTTM